MRSSESPRITETH
ncbi:Protein of unknown function [Propionibacterium freudenreichii]|nr:Protein of unknown function [Propionibacterium freudenreichii]CEG98590.1 Protein of unknown function [Propionibacterium freudenreichii]CEH06284.1 Protein of unknown function [Propionibacterium freudenreichii]CEH09703.1 Protein of unknown function [Propionibacterium freudenreichii]CEI24965.1 Protein of unknown function [Propionibacterium freudenreichii]